MRKRAEGEGKMHEWKKKASWKDNAVVKGVFPLKSIAKPSCTCSIQTQRGGNLLTLHVWIQVVLYLDWKPTAQHMPCKSKELSEGDMPCKWWPELFTVIFLELRSMTKCGQCSQLTYIFLGFQTRKLVVIALKLMANVFFSPTPFQ